MELIQSCLIYHLERQKINAGYVTTFNDYAVVSENRCTPISEKISTLMLHYLDVLLLQVLGLLKTKSVEIGESIAILGAGGIGLNIIQAAKWFQHIQLLQ